MESLLVLLLIANLAGLFLIWQRQDKQEKHLSKSLEDQADHLSDQLDYRFEQARQASQLDQKDLEVAVSDRLQEVRIELHQGLTQVRQEMTENLLQTRDKTDQRLQALQESNEQRLEQMRQTVEEKLEKTLQKTRGILGELQLGQIIEDIMTPAQYEREYATVENSSERVEYAIKLPGQGDQEYVYLPIDSKFPLADYYRLEEAYEAGDKDEIERCRKSLLVSVKRFAKDIRNKYIAPPRTTNFGVLFVPTEGLYSEIVRNPVFFDDLRREEQIIVAGPSTLSALLNSLSVGFKTLNIQKSADHISKTLASVKTEFGKFGGILVKAQKHLQHASGNIDELLNRRTTAIERTLRHIELSEGEPALDLLHFQENEEEYED